MTIILDTEFTLIDIGRLTMHDVVSRVHEGMEKILVDECNYRWMCMCACVYVYVRGNNNYSQYYIVRRDYVSLIFECTVVSVMDVLKHEYK